ncbi:SGNH/GDSL hydrolase family protein [Cohnella silvisoli]|uniref:SGNH/GDSL hydrolase family protein n=1 Tax=Cohnella silvisoli TaxID=2873699 RepID=A0ABV1KWK5_9BACL|nr:SGNH/GDSL hydrolase family protein [Cohnella silvisoli]MCD9024016.1 SGNH/GDSL hydrolase family protein [Cohnella silvisoli]
MSKLKVWNHRKPLEKTANALRAGALTIGFIGGSITDARSRHNWPEPVIAWFVQHYPQVRFKVENAAIGATGSELAVFRAERDLIDRGCHLVFIDYAVNDGEEPSDKRMRTREGLLRKLLQNDQCDTVLVYTFSQAFYREMMQDQVPASIAEFEQLAEHYRLGSIWMGLYAIEEVRKGLMRWEEWLPDGLHPTERGSLSYAQSVIAFLDKELREGSSIQGQIETHKLNEPLHNGHWAQAYAYPFEKVKLDGPWVIRRWPHLEWIDQVLETAAVGAKLAFTFRGRGLSLGFDFGKTSAEFRYRIDHGTWATTERDRPSWCGDDGWYRIYNIVDDLIAGDHSIELEVIHGDRPECMGTNFRLALIGVIV